MKTVSYNQVEFQTLSLWLKRKIIDYGKMGAGK